MKDRRDPNLCNYTPCRRIRSPLTDRTYTPLHLAGSAAKHEWMSRANDPALPQQQVTRFFAATWRVHLSVGVP
jgi:hypothetical protein